MKTRLVILAALSLLLAGSAVAQSEWTKVATFDAPFDFVVNGTTLPKGTYIVRTYTPGHNLMIQNINAARSVLVGNNNILLNRENRTHETSKVVFSPNSDGRQVLHSIAITGDDHTHDLIHGSEVIEPVSSH